MRIRVDLVDKFTGLTVMWSDVVAIDIVFPVHLTQDNLCIASNIESVTLDFIFNQVVQAVD